jgi:HNH endonuclease
MRIYSERDIERFWNKVDIRDPDECWDWKGGFSRKGYGRFTVKTRKIGAHIVAYELTYGPIIDLCVCHSCDRPMCCNPNHLWPGTHGDNLRDAYQKGRRLPLARLSSQAGVDNPRAILTEKNVRQILQYLPTRTNIEIGEMFGVHHSTISCIRRGKTWQDIILPVE